MRKQNFYIALIAILLFLTGVFNDQLVKLFFNTSGLLGALYVLTLISILIIHKVKDTNNYLRARNSELESTIYDLKHDKYKLIDKFTELKQFDNFLTNKSKKK